MNDDSRFQRCDYCKKNKPTPEVMLMAPAGKTAKWSCLGCIVQAGEMFAREPDCPACQRSLALVEATAAAHKEYLHTGRPMTLRIPRDSGQPHKLGCMNDFEHSNQ